MLVFSCIHVVFVNWEENTKTYRNLISRYVFNVTNSPLDLGLASIFHLLFKFFVLFIFFLACKKLKWAREFQLFPMESV